MDVLRDFAGSGITVHRGDPSGCGTGHHDHLGASRGREVAGSRSAEDHGCNDQSREGNTDVTVSVTGTTQHQEAVRRLRASYDAIAPGAPVRLAKRTSNLFRPRDAIDTGGLDVSGLDGVVSVDAEGRTADVQGMCTYEDLVDATLPHGLIPLVVPQLRTITLGGAVTGLGIESTSFRNGLPHESVLEMDVFTGAGEVVTCTPDNEHADLFATFPNSYGSLGYATRLRIELEPVASHVAVRHVRFSDTRALEDAIATITETGAWHGERVDALDGTAFEPGEYYLTLGRWVSRSSTTAAGERLRRPADLLALDPAARDRPADHLRLPVALGHRLVLVLPCLRRPAPDRAPVLAAAVQALRRLPQAGRARPPLRHRRPARPPGRAPRARAGDAGHRGAGRAARGVPRLVRRGGRDAARSGCARCGSEAPTSWPSYPLEPGRTYVNVGFWGAVPVGDDAPNSPLNRAIEAKVSELEGHKSLYSESFYDRGTFDRLYDGANLAAVKQRLRPRGPADQPLRQGGATQMTQTRPDPEPDRHQAHPRARCSSHSSSDRSRSASRRTTAAPTAPRTPHVGLELKNERGLAYLVTAPGDLGLARAYVSGDLDLHGIHPGDPYEGMVLLLRAMRFRRPSPAQVVQLLRSIGLSHLVPPPPPPQEHLPRWRRVMEGFRHSPERDGKVIQHHYDVSNRFYEMVLGPSMTYTCAVYESEDATLEEAQHAKYDLVARKLALQQGQRLLDVGCGWGGMVRHAAREYGVRALGVTLSREQAEWAQQRIKEEGLDNLAEVRHLDYRDVPETGFDAVSSIGLTEHIGVDNYPSYFGFLRDKMLPGCASAQPLHHPAGQPADPDRRVHRPLRVPRRRAHRLGEDHHRGPERRARGAARGEPARPLRQDPRPGGAPTWRPTGTSAWPRSVRAPRGSGVSTWPGRGWASSATRSSSTRCWRRGPTTTGRAGSRCGPTGEVRPVAVLSRFGGSAYVRCPGGG